uniref:Uncharacterized protein n=1 Tax=Knipowitschia caucasica TaxID=637954 RepID=A0AAV2JVX1_KNICA
MPDALFDPFASRVTLKGVGRPRTQAPRWERVFSGDRAPGPHAFGRGSSGRLLFREVSARWMARKRVWREGWGCTDKWVPPDGRLSRSGCR